MKRKQSALLIWILTAVISLAACAADGGTGSDAGFGNETPQTADQIKLTIEGATFPTLLDGPVIATPTATGTVTPVPLPTSTAVPRPTIAMAILQKMRAGELPLAAEVDVVLAEMHAPVTVVIAPDGRLFYTEKDTGNVRVVIDGVIQPEPVLIQEVGSHGAFSWRNNHDRHDFRHDSYLERPGDTKPKGSHNRRIGRQLTIKMLTFNFQHCFQPKGSRKVGIFQMIINEAYQGLCPSSLSIGPFGSGLASSAVT